MPTLTPSARIKPARARRRPWRSNTDDLDLREVLLDPVPAVEHALRVAMRGVDDDHVDAGLGQPFGAFLGAGTDADRSGHAQAALFVLGGERMLGGLHHVLDRDEAAQLARVVQDQHALEAMLAQQLARLVQTGAFAHGDQAILPGS